jgi:hypothetical protein
MTPQAELSGNLEMLGDWEARDVAEKQRRHDRVMDWVRSPAQLIKAIAIGVAALAALPLVLGIVLAITDKDASWILRNLNPPAMNRKFKGRAARPHRAVDGVTLRNPPRPTRPVLSKTVVKIVSQDSPRSAPERPKGQVQVPLREPVT